MQKPRKITVTLTRWEARAVLFGHDSLLDANGGHPDWRAFDRAVDKIQAQLNPPESERPK